MERQGFILVDGVRPKIPHTSLDDGSILLSASRISIVGREFRKLGARDYFNKSSVPIEHYKAVVRVKRVDNFAIGSRVSDRNLCPASHNLCLVDF